MHFPQPLNATAVCFRTTSVMEFGVGVEFDGLERTRERFGGSMLPTLRLDWTLALRASVLVSAFKIVEGRAIRGFGIPAI